MRFTSVSLSSLTDSATAVSLSQAVASTLLINGSLASGGIATLAAAQPISFDSASNLSAINFTVTGTDADGHSQSEVIAGPNNNAVITSGYYKTVSSITVSATSASTLTVGALAANGGVSSTIALNWRAPFFNNTFSVTFSDGSSATAALDTTFNDVQASTPAPIWYANSTFAASSINKNINVTQVTSGVRLRLKTWTSGTVTLLVLSSGYALGG
jgi:hypothetical protein